MPTVGVFSGPALGGKTTWSKRIVSLPEFAGAVMVRADDIRDQNWKGRKIHPVEADLIYEFTRMEIKRLLVVDRVETVIVEMPLRERALHQSPLAKMALSARMYLRKLSDDQNLQVNLRVVLLYADLPVIAERVRRRIEQLRGTGGMVYGMDTYLWTAERYQRPIAYEPLALDTSDESPENKKKLQEAIVGFLLSGTRPAMSMGTLDHAMRVFADAREEAQNRGLESH